MFELAVASACSHKVPTVPCQQCQDFPNFHLGVVRAQGLAEMPSQARGVPVRSQNSVSKQVVPSRVRTMAHDTARRHEGIINIVRTVAGNRDRAHSAPRSTARLVAQVLDQPGGRLGGAGGGVRVGEDGERGAGAG